MQREEILNLCVSKKVYQRGEELYSHGNVYVMSFEYDEEIDHWYIDAYIQGSRSQEYETWIEYDEKDDMIVNYDCTCSAQDNHYSMCKHGVALSLKALEENLLGSQMQEPVISMDSMLITNGEILNLIDQVAKKKRQNRQKPEGKIELVPKIIEKGSYYMGFQDTYLTFRIGSQRLYVLKNISKFVDAVEKEERISYGKQLSFVHSKSVFTAKTWEMVCLIRESAEYQYGCIHKEWHIEDAQLARFLLLNLGDSIEYESDLSEKTILEVLDMNPPVQIAIRQDGEDSYTMALPKLRLIEGKEDVFVLYENKAYHCDSQYLDCMLEVLRLANQNQVEEYAVAVNDMHRLYNEVLIDMENLDVLDKGELSFETYLPKPLQVAYYLDENEQHVMVKIMGNYDGESFNLLDADQTVHYRDYDREQQALAIGKAYFGEENKKEHILYFSSDDEDKRYQLFDTGILQMEGQGKVYASERFHMRKIVRSPKAKMGISLENSLLSLKIDSDEFSKSELYDILQSYRKKKKFYRLRSGNYLSLEDNLMSAITQILDRISAKKKDFNQEQLSVPKYLACYIDQVLQKDAGRLEIQRNTDYRALIRDMKNVTDSDYEVPKSLCASLRRYQKTGYRWLRTLAHYGFGGILADDMGLGKTIQTIAYLLARKEVGIKKQSLIICPASLVYNWQKEFEHFAPSLHVRMMVGSASIRKQKFALEDRDDVWITSYDTAKRDIVLYQECRFDTLVIDEAQNIKNHNTQVAKAVKLIPSDIRFALTGTPIENRLSELWSIFDYLMPGILESYEKFRKKYENPIILGQDQSTMEQLKKLVSPFILRRVKKDVLKELPDKVEQIVYAQMDSEQKKLYTGHALNLLTSLEQQSQEQIRRGKLEILAELTKLRQICCDPSLLYEDYQAGACKVDMCEELVKDAIAGNHKVLIFSQFTSIFPILEERLKKSGISYYELTGHTPKQKRMQMVESFNKNDVPVFLISLKAGGTGLNLTSASIVIHFDPWWNLAAQNQATDRAHRIGQENQVVVFKLIVKDTIEEKIIELQKKKQELADEILGEEGISAASLTREDLMAILR
ncbi:MAG: SNF2 helicase associated domain-containing protein [Lachnospiraceae bacterium]|nr:SNF2 helicase associated domain-containing protein [Lachnospiraceae bacterium]